MREMEMGDLGFFYHSQKAREIVGIVEVCAMAHPDSTTDDTRWECVDIRAVADVADPVSLEQIKSDPRLSDMVLVRNSRLSVQPVSREQWEIILSLGATEL
jgi:predicted RNA-binding protein with PUA-like domain